MRFPCPCCGHLTLGEPAGSGVICRVCFWEDDPAQLRWPDARGGANQPSLREAQRTFEAIGACEDRVVELVRPPLPGEPREPGWRPIDPVLDGYEQGGVQDAPWPADRADLYWWRPTYWRAPQPETTRSNAAHSNAAHSDATEFDAARSDASQS